MTDTLRRAHDTPELSAEATARKSVEEALRASRQRNDTDGEPHRTAGSISDLDARRRAEDALRLSEERYALALEAAEEGHFDNDLETGQIFVSARVNEIYGFPHRASTLNRIEFLNLIPLHPDDRPRVLAELSKPDWEDPAGDLYEIECRIVPRPGEIRWIHSRAKIVRDAEGRARRRIGVVADITDRKRAENLLAGEKELLEMMARAMPLPTVLDALCRIVEESCGEGICSILLVDRSGVRLEYGAAPGLPREYQQAVHGAPINPDSGPCAMAAALREQVISADLAADTRWAGKEWRTLALQQGLRSCWSTPIFSSANSPLGTFAVYRRHPGRPATADQAIIERFTHLAAVAIERSHTEKDLRESEARFRSVIELAPVAIALVTRTQSRDSHQRTGVLQINQEFTRMFGFAPEEVVGKQLGALLAPGDLHDGYAVNADALIAGNRVDSEVVRQRKDGAYIHVHLTGVPIRLDDKTECSLLMYRDLTERERATKVLRESEARFRTLTELSSDWYWAQDENMRFTYFSGRRQNWAGYPTATSIGKARWELEGITPVSGSWSEHRAMLEARLPFRDFEYLRVAKNGEIVYATVSGSPVFDERGRFVGYQGVTKDITERKRVEEALREQTERLQLGQAAMRMIVMDWNVAEDLLTWSDSPEWLRGPMPASGFYPAFKDQVHPEDRDSFLATRSRALETLQVQTTEFRLVRTDGEVIWVLERKHAFVGADGKAARMLAAMFDITERKRLEQELRRAQSLEALGTLAGGIAHDFNNILGAILGYGEMASRDAKQGTRLRRDLDSIMAAGERGRALVERVLAFSRSGVGERVPVHVEAVVREALDQVAARVPENVNIVPRLRAGQAAMLGDPTQVHQVVMNLATNAVQAMPQGGVLGVTLKAVPVETARPATVGSIASGDYIVLKVSDSGTGIPDDVLGRMFDPFFTTKEVGVGSGLGLSLVHGIVTSVGGAIDVATAAGEGSSFTVYLPRSGDAAGQQVDENRPLPRGAGQRVLVVDDEEPLVRLATEVLENLGYSPVGFTSSSAALGAFRADPQRFDVVITDERMPELAGSALIGELRGIRRSIPIVLMSGHVGGGFAQRARDAGANDVLKKPLLARDLAASLAKVLHP